MNADSVIAAGCILHLLDVTYSAAAMNADSVIAAGCILHLLDVTYTRQQQ